MLELDVHLTADETVVVSHDDHLVRTTGEDVHIKKTFYKVTRIISYFVVGICSLAILGIIFVAVRTGSAVASRIATKTQA